MSQLGLGRDPFFQRMARQQAESRGDGLIRNRRGRVIGREEDSSTPPSESQAPTQAPAQSTEPIVDRNAARDEVYNQMKQQYGGDSVPVSYTHLRAHET